MRVAPCPSSGHHVPRSHPINQHDHSGLWRGYRRRCITTSHASRARPGSPGRPSLHSHDVSVGYRRIMTRPSSHSRLWTRCAQSARRRGYDRARAREPRLLRSRQVHRASGMRRQGRAPLQLLRRRRRCECVCNFDAHRRLLKAFFGADCGWRWRCWSDWSNRANGGGRELGATVQAGSRSRWFR